MLPQRALVSAGEVLALLFEVEGRIAMLPILQINGENPA